MATAKLQLSFRIFKNGQLVAETQLNQSVIKIGKVPSAHLKVDDESVSRMHAIIEVIGDEVSVIDLGSTGGTFVNGQKINKARLQSGDTITVGQTRLEIAIGAPSVVIAPELAPVAAAVTAPAPVAAPALAQTVTAPVARPPAIPVRTAPVMPVARPVTMPMMAPMANLETEVPGAQAVEVAAMLGDSVVGVKHCMDARGGKVTPLTWGFVAGGVAMLIASASAFAYSVNTAARNQAALEVHIERGKPAHAFRPEPVSYAVDGIAFGGLALGIAGLTAALARSRRERKDPAYRIGTAPDVSLAIDTAPTPSFPLVAPQGDDFVFNFGAGMTGELTVDGQATTFAELVASGRAKPSASTAGALELPIPAKGKIRAQSGQTTFLVTAVAQPRAATAPLFTVENRTLGYVGGSLAAHLAAVMLLNLVPTDAAGVSAGGELNSELTAVSTNTMKDDMVPEPPEQDNSGEEAGGKEAGAAMRLAEGSAGKPDSPRTDGRMTMKNNDSVEPHLAREQALEAARTAGVLGNVQAIKGGIASLTGTQNFSSGFEDADIYGPLIGSSGEGRGNFGFGRNGWGAGGGCTQEPCGTYGTGRYGTVPNGRSGGGDYDGPGNGWGRGGRRTPRVPQPVLGTANPVGNLDKEIIRRYIKRNITKVAYCYESELLARPGIEGTVMVNFLISGTGIVTSSQGSGFDGKVASCVAGVVKAIEFPRPTDGGNVIVNYPFTFHAAGK
jgi:hypothetical protein